MKDRIMAWISLNAPTVGTVALIIAAVVLISGCNTVAGMGTDITKSAEWSRDKMTGSKNTSNKGNSQ